MDNKDVNVVEYAEFVIKQINFLKKQVEEFKSKPDIFPVDVRNIAKNKLFVAVTLRSQFSLIIKELSEKEREFKIWWNKRYNQMREDRNSIDLPSSKWISKTDIEALVISKFEEEYSEFSKELSDLQNKKQFMRDLLEDWKNTSYDLSTIIKSLEIEGYNT